MHKLQIPLRRSLRFKLIAVSLLIEVGMLGLLLTNSLRLLNDTLEEQTQARIEEITPLFNAALSARLFERDHATIKEILTQLFNSHYGGFRYIVVYDQHDEVYASIGSVDLENLPALDADISAIHDDRVYDQSAPLSLSGERVGHVRYGLSVDSFIASRDTILNQGLIIASSEVALSFLLLTAAGLFLTRHIRGLLDATQTLTDGDYSKRVPVHSPDEIGLLASNFNVMAEAIRDRIHALHESEQALFQEKERAEVTLHSIGDAVITTDVCGNVEYLNPVAEQLTGWDNAQAKGQPLGKVFNIVDEFTERPVENPVEKCLRTDTIITLQNHTVLIRRDGKRFPIEDSAAPIRDRDNHIIGVVLVFHDVSHARHMSRLLSYRATHDALTELYNRAEFERRLAETLEQAGAEGSKHAMCYLDLDQFKVVNDVCGHVAGDELLRQLGRLLKTKIRESDMLARLGGDEFGVLLNHCSPEDARSIAAIIRDSIKEFRFVWQDKSFEVGVSIGVVPIQEDSGPVSEILAAADLACYVAKDRGRNQIHYHQPDDEEYSRRRGEMQWSTRIAKALEEDRFVLYHQNIIPLNKQAGSTRRAEILLRLRDEDGVLIGPGAFIPGAERYRNMTNVDRHVVTKVLQTLVKMPINLYESVTINLSGQSLCDDQFLDFVIARIDESGIDPMRLCFEITETTAIANLSHATRFIGELRNKGCKFALDDFGSGLSSFAYLKNLPVDYLKIDGGFVRDIIDDATHLAMVESINQIGHIMGIQTVAEFVESEAVLNKLREIGVDYAQGYALHRPEPFELPKPGRPALMG